MTNFAHNASSRKCKDYGHACNDFVKQEDPYLSVPIDVHIFHKWIELIVYPFLHAPSTHQ